MSERRPRLRAANLNLVPVLRALLREASVTKAATSLALSPSATSCALADLRVLFADPLLVQVGRAMHRTPKAEQLVGRLEQACLALEELLRDDAFDPANAERTFILAAPDYISLLLAPRLIARLRAEAPGIRLRFVDVPGDLERHLALGLIDLGFVAVNVLKWKGIASAIACKDRLVAVVDADHPLAAKAGVTSDDLARYPAIDWVPSLGLSNRVTIARVHRPAATAEPIFVSQHQTTLPIIIQGTDIIATVPKAFARRMCQFLRLAIIELPSEVFEIETRGLWSKLQDADPSHAWLREAASQALAQAHRDGT